MRLRHVVMITPLDNARLTWPLIWKPLHDALMEDALDRAEAAATGQQLPVRKWPWHVRLLRSMLKQSIGRT